MTTVPISHKGKTRLGDKGHTAGWWPGLRFESQQPVSSLVPKHCARSLLSQAHMGGVLSPGHRRQRLGRPRHLESVALVWMSSCPHSVWARGQPEMTAQQPPLRPPGLSSLCHPGALTQPGRSEAEMNSSPGAARCGPGEQP
ncbi:hypothetical protein H1C71_042144 [Ictidomys tridecemlineatus]|nr:hypothetical protein H1C71_042144 [Ictidomys tridecemlineatus]